MFPYSSNSDRTARKVLKVGLVGLGYWGPNLLRVLAEMSDVEIAWICDLDPDRLDPWSRRYPAAQATAELDRVLDDATVDAVLIATPPFSHADLATRCLEARKHIFVEKPLATSSGEAADMLDLAESRDLVLMCGHTFLYSPPVQAIKGLLDAGELGELYFITSSRVNLGLHQPDVSVIWDLGPHDFSILRHWLGEMPDSLSAAGRASIMEDVPDVAFLTLRYPSGVLANLEMSWLAPSKLRRTVLVGSEKMVVYEDGAVEPVRIFDHGVIYKDPTSFGEYQLSYRTGDILSPRIDTFEPLATQLAEFADCVSAREAPEGHGELCLDVVRMIEAAEASLRGGGAVISTADVLGSPEEGP